MKKTGTDRWIRRLLGLSAFTGCFILGVSQAYAMALGKIEVASHLGEVFFAEIPMQLEENESISSVFVELASPADYRILEVYRDPALNAVRSDIKKDSRGTRVALSSDSVIDAPFFNLILKVRHGHATQFKKYPVFLDLLQVKPVQARVLPKVSAVTSQKSAEQEVQPETPVSTALPVAASDGRSSTTSAFKPYDGWARSKRYGPMVYGDTIRTVAIRLRMDERYTEGQVMMALFNKNREKFSQANINLINAGTYLDVPKASDVEELTPSEASQLLTEHQKAWNALKKGQPRYTAVAEAQKNRYKTRVRVGKVASGVASAPVPDMKIGEKTETADNKSATGGVPATTAVVETVTPDSTQQTKLDALRQENTALQENLKTAGDKIDALSDKLASADVVAANARIRKLELSLARLQAELDKSRQEAQSSGGVTQSLTYLLGGLVVLLLVGLGYLLRRERPHPAVASTSASVATVTPSQEDEGHRFGGVAQQPVDEEPEQPGMPTPAQEAEDASPGTTPDIMESDTDEAEVPKEGVEGTLDPNVDYIAEADIYLRYGMEDEAIDQIRMAIKQRPDNADAYITLIRTLQSKGDQEALNAAMEAGRGVLIGEALQAFEAAASPPTDEDGAGIDLDSILSPADIDVVASSETEKVTAEESGENGEYTLVPGEEIDTTEDEPLEVEAEQLDESMLAETFELLDKTTASREESETEISEPVTGEETGKQDKMEDEARSFPELSLSETSDFDLDIPPVTGEENETTGHVAEGEAESLDIETSKPDDVDEIVETHDTGLESMELDELITTPAMGVAPDSLYIDKARSLLAEGELDEAESSFEAAVNADNTQADALLGLADVAQKRGDATKASEFLTKAEALVDDSNREWFESIKRALDQ